MAQQWRKSPPGKRRVAAVADDPHRPRPSAARLRRIRRLARLLDESIRLPGTSYRIGLDGLLGLVPGVGDTLGVLLSSYIVYDAWQLHVPKRILLRMMGNIALDAVIGTVPLAGDVFDVVWKANKRNLAILERYFQHAETE